MPTVTIIITIALTAVVRRIIRPEICKSVSPLSNREGGLLLSVSKTEQFYEMLLTRGKICVTM
jgi:hypothetical protein